MEDLEQTLRECKEKIIRLECDNKILTEQNDTPRLNNDYEMLKSEYKQMAIELEEKQMVIDQLTLSVNSF